MAVISSLINIFPFATFPFGLPSISCASPFSALVSCCASVGGGGGGGGRGAPVAARPRPLPLPLLPRLAGATLVLIDAGIWPSSRSEYTSLPNKKLLRL